MLNGALTRRKLLKTTGCGFGALALSGLIGDAASGALTPPIPAATPKAKRVIFLFMQGGPSHVDSFDFKPDLERFDGQQVAFDDARTIANTGKRGTTQRVMKSPWSFRPYGECGHRVSDLFPHTAQCMDDIAVIRSCHGDMVVHSAAQYELFSGRTVPGFPSLGSWLVYGLGCETQSLPAYVVMPDPKGALEAGQPMYMPGFLPAVYQPTMFRPGDRPVLNLSLPSQVEASQRRKTVDLIRQLNQATVDPHDEEFHARIQAYDVAFRMQAEAPEIFDLSRETRETLELYGVGKEPTDDYGRRCLLARKLVEQGVRFVCVVSGGGPGNMQWDAHGDVEENHLRKAAETDQPVAALLKDLKARGLLDDTIVIWTTEFGRLPISEGIGEGGRDHNPEGFTSFMAGAGLKPGYSYGRTDELGYKATEKPVTIYDFHATLLHLLGLDHTRLSWYHNGLQRRLTDVHGHVIRDVLA